MESHRNTRSSRSPTQAHLSTHTILPSPPSQRTPLARLAKSAPFYPEALPAAASKGRASQASHLRTLAPQSYVSSRTQSRAFSVPPQFGGRGTQRGICFLRNSPDSEDYGALWVESRLELSAETSNWPDHCRESQEIRPRAAMPETTTPTTPSLPASQSLPKSPTAPSRTSVPQAPTRIVPVRSTRQ